jgi:DNA-binding beta-propeller fold protein YncE
VIKLRATALFTLLVLLTIGVRAQENAPLELLQKIPIPGLKDGDFDHFAVDLPGQRLFLTAEMNAAVEVFDLRTNKLIHTISDVKTPHSMVYRDDLKKLFVVDGGAPGVKVYDADSYKLIETIELLPDADSMAYDSSTKYMYIVNGGDDSHMSYSNLSIFDTTTAKKLGDIKIDSDKVEALTLEMSGPRLFIDITGKDVVGVIDREKRTVIATWPTVQAGKHLVAMAFDEPDHRLFVTTRDPGKLVVLDSNSGKIVTSVPCVGLNDDMVYDSESKRIYVAGSEFVDVFQQNDADHYARIGHIPGAFRAKTAILVPQLKRYYLAVPHHGTHEAEVRVYKVLP